MANDEGPARAAAIAVNVFDVSPADDDFTALRTATPLDWVRLSGLPRGPIERHVRGVRLSRYRAAWAAAGAARAPGSFLISHLPLMSAAVEAALAVRGRRRPHLAFAFNFTRLPEGARLAYLRRALPGITRFAVFSQFERGLYAERLGLDPARIRPVLWTQAPPPVAPGPGVGGSPYVCAIGGEGRDFATLFAAARRVKGLRLIVIARPHSLAGLDPPEGVEVRVNIPLAEVWRIASDSCGVLVPLQAADTCCGHVTLVSAKLLGLPLATTWSRATREYVEGRGAVLECAPGDVAGYARLIERLMDEPAALRAQAEADRPHELSLHDRAGWADFLDAFVAEEVPA